MSYFPLVKLKNILGVIINPATYDAQTDGSQRTQIVDASNNVIGSYPDLDNDVHLAVSAIQSIHYIASNASIANLAGGATFTGAAVLAISGSCISVALKSDVNCLVFVDQSTDGVNWDIVDSFNYYYSIDNFSTSVQSVAKYFRVRVTNTGSITSTVFRLQTGVIPIGNPFPRTTDANGHFLTAVHVIEDAYGFDVENTPNGEMRSVIPTLLVGSAFEGSTVDPNFWTSTVTNGGTAAQANSIMTLATNTTANGTAKLLSVRRARYLPGQSMVARFQVQQGNTGVTNNKRNWGIAFGASLPTLTDGAYFQLNGTTFSIATFKGSVETVVSSGSFNGTFGSLYVLDTNVHTYEIYYNNRTIYFTIDGAILHTVSGAASLWANTVEHYIYLDNMNSGGITSNNTLLCRVAGIRRLGALLGQPTSKFQSGTTAGIVLKHGAGNLHGIAVGAVANNSVITLYDNTAASGTTIYSTGAMSANTVPFFIDLKGIPFFIGLTLAITAASSNTTVMYE